MINNFKSVKLPRSLVQKLSRILYHLGKGAGHKRERWAYLKLQRGGGLLVRVVIRLEIFENYLVSSKSNPKGIKYS